MTLSLQGVHEHAAHDDSLPVEMSSLPLNARLVLEALVEADEPCKAYSLLERLRDKGVSAPMTVYRALDRLTELGHIRRIESLNAYIALPAELHDQPVAFRICRRCHRTEIIPLDRSTLRRLDKSGILDGETYIEVYHDCCLC